MSTTGPDPKDDLNEEEDDEKEEEDGNEGSGG